MAVDVGKEKHFTQEERVQVERNLMTPIQALYGGSCVEIVVPDFDFGRAMVEGENSLLKTAIDERSRSWGVGRLKSDSAQFQVVDFTKFRDPKVVLREAMDQIPKIRRVDPTMEGRSFNDFYPGKVMVIIGAEDIPQDVDVFDLNVIAKRAPTAFVRREVTVTERLNPHVLRAIGEYSKGNFRALEE